MKKLLIKKQALRKLVYNNLISLSSEEGIYASHKEEVYGCVFGRDSAITILKIIRACSNSRTNIIDKLKLLEISKRALLNLIKLQGRDVNPDSGEEPGKFIHEYRKEKFERLISGDSPWYVYPDGILRNYDSIDATPLGLIAIYKYWKITRDYEFLLHVLPHIERGLEWIMTYADRDGDFLIEYSVPNERKHGGLMIHSWTDSHESLARPDGTMPSYPIAPVEVQGYAWLALKLWAKFFRTNKLGLKNLEYASRLRSYARNMKRSFNKHFIFKDEGLYYAAQALDGEDKRIETITGNPLLLLWASHVVGGKTYSILKKKYIPDLVERAFKPDLFERTAGIRTMSTKSPTFNGSQNSYHNGSFWPKLNGMIHEGLLRWGFLTEAAKLRRATLLPIAYFGTPIELYVKDESGFYKEYRANNGQVSCRVQAWTAAVALDLLTHRTKRKS